MKILDYLFRPIPGSPFSYYIPLLILAILIIGYGIYMLRLLRKRKEDRALRKLFSGIPGKTFWIGATLLLNLGARYERFPLVGARFVLFITLGFFTYYVIKYIRVYKKTYPKLQEQMRETPMQKKYTTAKRI